MSGCRHDFDLDVPNPFLFIESDVLVVGIVRRAALWPDAAAAGRMQASMLGAPVAAAKAHVVICTASSLAAPS